MTSSLRFSAGIALASAVAAWACSDGSVDSGGVSGGGGGSSVIPSGKGKGEACSTTSGSSGGCRSGLTCTDGACAFAGTQAEGDACVAAAECAAGLQCALGLCAPAGTGEESDGCSLDTDCEQGLRCGIVGFGAQCVPEGTTDAGQACALSTDCHAGMICAVPPRQTAATCTPIPRTGPGAGLSFGLPVPPALQCEPASEGTVKAYFEVPGADGTDPAGDFFRLPFPNDARIQSGKIDLTGFPTPGTAFLGFDPVKLYVDAISETESAWGVYGTVIFRFSGLIDFDTFRAVDGQESPVQILDVTDPNAVRNAGAEWGFSPQGGKYVCHDWMWVRRHVGSPLEPDRTYAVLLSSTGRAPGGQAIERSPQLVALLDDAAPTDPALASAHASYAPLRAYLAAEGRSPDTVLNASVITTAPVQSLMAGLAKAVTGADAPAATGWVKCGGDAVSPCPQAEGDRACGPSSADYDEYHAMVDVPIFQRGTAPYLTDADGGDIQMGPVVRTEAVCAALTVPKGAAPAAGFPLVVFGHGTGGSFRSHIRDEVAGALATAPNPMAVLGYDAVQHGSRRADSTASPNNLFFNFRNPKAARGNPLQGAADVLTLGRLARSLTVPASATGGAAIAIDGAHVLYYGHSQGSMHGSLALPYTNDYVATVLSGNGASLMDALLTKTEPENIAQAVPFALGGDVNGEGNLFGGLAHPVLSLLQQWTDPADPLSFARILTREPGEGILAKSVFQTYGLGDTYSPPKTMQIYAIAADLPIAAHDPSVSTPDDIVGRPEVPVPLAGNFAIADRVVTLAVRQYQNTTDRDGHFVVFDVPSATGDVVRFLSMAAAGDVPAVGQ